jgi:DNA-binding PadR family transcriptional regulator
MNREPLPTGQVDLLLLSIVARGPAHGYAIIDTLRVLSAGAFDQPEGTIYPALYRLEEQGLLASREQAVAGRRRRIYRLTARGRRALVERRDAWRALVRDVDVILEAGARHA